jgi:hypothetical protein
MHARLVPEGSTRGVRIIVVGLIDPSHALSGGGFSSATQGTITGACGAQVP